jgi:hypothetical protein
METLETSTTNEAGIRNTFIPDIEMIRRIYDGLEKQERTMGMKEYLRKQTDEALSEENKVLAAAAYGKDIDFIAPDEAMLFYSLSGQSERFSLENMRFRNDKTLDEIKGYYKKYLPDEK